MKNAIVLCSGGLDSVTTSYYVRKKLGYQKMMILFFNYNQKSLRKERQCSKNCADNLRAKFEEVELKWLGEISNSLINKEGKANKISKENLKDTKEESKNWYVPCRNLVFLSNAMALAEALSIQENSEWDIFVGFKFDAEGGYPDTTPEFVKSMNKIGEIGSSKKIKIIAPLIEKDKEDIVKLGKELGVNFKETHSCYVENKNHCGVCLACQLRKQGFYWAGVEDKTEYNN